MVAFTHARAIWRAAPRAASAELSDPLGPMLLHGQIEGLLDGEGGQCDDEKVPRDTVGRQKVKSSFLGRRAGCQRWIRPFAFLYETLRCFLNRIVAIVR